MRTLTIVFLLCAAALAQLDPQPLNADVIYEIELPAS